MRRWRGLKSLMFDVLDEATHLSEQIQASTVKQISSVARKFSPSAPAIDLIESTHDALSAGVYGIVRGVQQTVDVVVEQGLTWAEKAKPSTALEGSHNNVGSAERVGKTGSVAWMLEQAEGALNGVLGEHLHAQQNELALEFEFRHQGMTIPITHQAMETAFPNATGRLCIFVHGLSATEWCWQMFGERYHGDANASIGARLEAELGYTPLYLRYNSGRHISENGRLLSERLEQLLAVYPREIEEIVLIGHSMGGLVVRSAAHCGEKQSAAWIGRLRHVYCLGAPHLGAPLEKAVNVLGSVLEAIPSPGTQVVAHLLNRRSAGIKDLRFGYISEEEWEGVDPDMLLANHRRIWPPVEGVRYFFLAAHISPSLAHPLGMFIGDLMVRIPSATGQDGRQIPCEESQIFDKMNHLELLNHPDVYAFLHRNLQA